MNDHIRYDLYYIYIRISTCEIVHEYQKIIFTRPETTFCELICIIAIFEGGITTIIDFHSPETVA